MILLPLLFAAPLHSLTKGPWDQEKFKQLLTEWVVACDQPFDAVKKPEFVELMIYAHHPASSIKIPG